MLESVSKGFRAAKHRILGRAELTEELIDESLQEIRLSLLEADVALEVVRKFIATVREKSLGAVVPLSAKGKGGRRAKVSAGDHFVKICHDELEALMGPVDTSLGLKAKGQLTSIMLVGLQGSGKTTTAGKLASRLLGEGRKPLLVAADIYRPAAVEQLKILGASISVPVFHEEGRSPAELAKLGLERARAEKRDVVIVDTAGRVTIDEPLMQELEQVRAAISPESILLVADAMTGQDAVRSATAFDKRLSLHGFILTKLDGDARGGAALSMKEVTGKPIKFLGSGEGLDKLEEFRPAGLASRILGLGDVVGLMKDFEGVVDEERAEEDAKKLLSGKFDLKDFVSQLRMVRKMGPLKDLMEKLPFFGEQGMPADEKALDVIEALFNSMTEAERRKPELITGSRAQRIAAGAGKKPADVQDLLKKFQTMRGMLGALGQNPGLLGRLPFFKDLGALSRLKDMGLKDAMGGDPLFAQALASGEGAPSGFPGLPKGYTPPMHQAALARARLDGYAGREVEARSDEERKALKARRKREKENRKKSRRR